MKKPEPIEEIIQDPKSGLKFKVKSEVGEDGFLRWKIQPEFKIQIADGMVAIFPK